jgi:hypothetical protein
MNVKWQLWDWNTKQRHDCMAQAQVKQAALLYSPELKIWIECRYALCTTDPLPSFFCLGF